MLLKTKDNRTQERDLISLAHKYRTPHPPTSFWISHNDHSTKIHKHTCVFAVGIPKHTHAHARTYTHTHILSTLHRPPSRALRGRPI